jgi:hypothetical protein
MRWVTFHGSPTTHAVLRGATETLCELSIVGASIARLGVDHRCRGCDIEWREKGRKKRPKKIRPKRSLSEYQPRFAVEWERETPRSSCRSLGGTER